MNTLLPYASTTIVVFSTIAVLLVAYYLLSKSKLSERNLAPKAQGGWPIIGHLPLIAGSSQLPHFTLGALADKYGSMFTIRVGLFPTLVISSWEVAKEIFTTNDTVVSSRPKGVSGKYQSYNYADFGFTPYGPFWRDMRKLVAVELLSPQRVEMLKHLREHQVHNSVKELHKEWRKSGGHSLVKMTKWMGDLNLNVIVQMVAGKRIAGVGVDDEKANRCLQALRTFFHLAGVFVLRDAVPFLGWLDFGGYEKAMKENAKEMDSIIGEWIAEHRNNRESCKGDYVDKDFIDVMLSQLQGMDLAGFDADTVNKATCSVLIAGGTDTMTVSTIWTIVLLLNNPSVLNKAREEIDAHVGKDRLVTESDITNFVYLQAIIKESLRLHPAGKLGGARVFAKDCTINGYRVEKGTRLITNLHKLQRDPRVWSEPNEFKPERFLTEQHKGIDVKGQHFELIPFGAGRRICPGWAFAPQVMRLIVATFIHAFDMSTPTGVLVDMTETAGMTNGLATPLEVLIKPRLDASAYEGNIPVF